MPHPGAARSRQWRHAEPALLRHLLGNCHDKPKPDERCLVLQVATMQQLIHVAAAVSVTVGLAMGCCSLVSHHAAPVTTTSVK